MIYYVLFFIHLATRRVHIAGLTPHPNEPWMIQVARNVTMADVGFLSSSRYLIHDRDSKFCESFRDTIEGVGVTPVRLPARNPDLNAFAERWVRSVKEECLSKLILFGENSLRHALREYVAHHHHERNHQGKDNLLLFPEPAIAQTNGLEGAIQCRERLGGLLRFYHRQAALNILTLRGCSVSTIGKPHEYFDLTGKLLTAGRSSILTRRPHANIEHLDCDLVPR